MRSLLSASLTRRQSLLRKAVTFEDEPPPGDLPDDDPLGEPPDPEEPPESEMGESEESDDDDDEEDEDVSRSAEGEQDIAGGELFISFSVSILLPCFLPSFLAS